MTETAKPDTTSGPEQANPRSSGRDPRGRFCKGNPGGPGNPFARQTAALRKAFVEEVSTDDLRAIVRSMIDKARNGDVGAARLVCSYALGRPTEAPDPDRLDENEWQQWQRDTAAGNNLGSVMSGMSTTLACDLARAAVPHVQAALGQTISAALSAFDAAPEEEPDDAEEPEQAGEQPQEPQHSQDEGEPLDKLRRQIEEAVALTQKEQRPASKAPTASGNGKPAVNKPASPIERVANPPEQNPPGHRQQTEGAGAPTAQKDTVSDGVSGPPG